ncbi:thiopeptide-type bacteriocin biosynthesis protein [Elizabethkingia ursingii]|uniref:thiopeptide-type bacteriocin biosynthesis protein n=1 Tax=Elizabethkingia ursingii TaxID=1756150 RepID=UPI002012A01E|nr:thiopeptide-type bacteriocin biosynthesis protein [Elizabethkingia ursingii]MCL1662916.1 thiopeptide-type bacteriocin biosynthesis protein [Elizabethkingia ursingii]
MSKKKRNFIIGSEWVYYKIYGNPEFINLLLVKFILPLTNKLAKDGISDMFFFIRYNDPDFHLRLRFKPNANKIGELISSVYKLLDRESLRNKIYKVQIDTYQRELERYGDHTIDLVEELFYLDSIKNIKLLKLALNDQQRWLCALVVVDCYFNLSEINLNDRIIFIKKIITNLKVEYNIKSSEYTKVLLEGYNENKNVLRSFFFDKTNEPHFYYKLENEYYIKQKKIMESIKLESSKNKGKTEFLDMLGSIIHMSLNRFFVYDARFSEMVLYEYLLKIYNEKINNKNFFNEKK